MSIKELIKRTVIFIGLYFVIFVAVCLIGIAFVDNENSMVFAGGAAAVLLAVFAGLAIILVIRRMAFMSKLNSLDIVFENEPREYIRILGELGKKARFPEDKFVFAYNTAAAYRSLDETETAKKLLEMADSLSVSRGYHDMCRKAISLIEHESVLPEQAQE